MGSNNGFSQVKEFMFKNMQLVPNNNFNNQNFSNNIINIQKQTNLNNPFIHQINQFNNNFQNMQIDISQPKNIGEISVTEAQGHNKNFMKYFECDYLAGEQEKDNFPNPFQ